MPVPQRDLRTTRRQLAGWLAERLPDARNLRISELTGPGATGFSTDTLLFDLRFEEAGRERHEPLVARVAPAASAVFPRYDLARQFRVLQALHGTDVPVPRPLWLEESASVIGQPFLVMERVEGRAPPDQPPYHAEGWFADLPPDERRACWWQGLETLARIHRLDPNALGLDFPVDTTATTGPPVQTLAYYESYLAWVSASRPLPVSESALRWLKRHQPPPVHPPRLCWGDARLGNMLFRDGRCVAVLDWEMATLGDPDSDLGWWLFFDRHHSEGFGVPRLPGLPEREETIARYEAWTGRAVKNLHYWEVFAAFGFSIIMARVARKLVDFGVLPPDSRLDVDNGCRHLLERMLGEASSEGSPGR
jgi:aminoglycoside phosphotransferase (APT) family kinase protein